MTRPPKSKRPVTEMLERLREHAALLRDYIERVQRDGDRKYLGEIAAKVRVLAIDGRSNTALMLRLGELVGGTPMVRIDGPPGWTFLDGHKTGDVITLREWLDSFLVGVRTPSAPDDLARLSRKEFVLIWAQQHGGAHEDWELDERFAASRDIGVTLMGQPANDRMLLNIAALVLRRAEQLLADFTPERIAEAEAALNAESTR